VEGREGWRRDERYENENTVTRPTGNEKGVQTHFGPWKKTSAAACGDCRKVQKLKRPKCKQHSRRTN